MENQISISKLREEWLGMDRKDRLYLAMAAFMGGVGFTMIAFHVNHKNILNESLYVWSAVLLVCLGLCVKYIYRT